VGNNAIFNNSGNMYKAVQTKKKTNTWQGLVLPLSYFGWQRKESSWSLRISCISVVLAAIKGLCMEYNYFITE